MPLLDTQQKTNQLAGKTIFRNATRCFKLSEDEARLLDQVASAAGVPRSEWMRNAVLCALHAAPSTDPSFAEVLGIRLLLVNVLRPLATGQKVSVETFDKLLDEISTAKHELAAKLTAESRR